MIGSRWSGCVLSHQHLHSTKVLAQRSVLRHVRDHLFRKCHRQVGRRLPREHRVRHCLCRVVVRGKHIQLAVPRPSNREPLDSGKHATPSTSKRTGRARRRLPADHSHTHKDHRLPKQRGGDTLASGYAPWGSHSSLVVDGSACHHSRQLAVWAHTADRSDSVFEQVVAIFVDNVQLVCHHKVPHVVIMGNRGVVKQEPEIIRVPISPLRPRGAVCTPWCTDCTSPRIWVAIPRPKWFEVVVVRIKHGTQHHLQPNALGVPVEIYSAWYVTGCNHPLQP